MTNDNSSQKQNFTASNAGMLARLDGKNLNLVT